MTRRYFAEVEFPAGDEAWWLPVLVCCQTRTDAVRRMDLVVKALAGTGEACLRRGGPDPYCEGLTSDSIDRYVRARLQGRVGELILWDRTRAGRGGTGSPGPGRPIERVVPEGLDALRGSVSQSGLPLPRPTGPIEVPDALRLVLVSVPPTEQTARGRRD